MTNADICTLNFKPGYKSMMTLLTGKYLKPKQYWERELALKIHDCQLPRGFK